MSVIISLLLLPILINSQEISLQGELLIRDNHIDDQYQYFLKKYDNSIIQLSFNTNIIYDNIITWSSVKIFGNFDLNNIFIISDILPLSSRLVPKCNELNLKTITYYIEKICNKITTNSFNYMKSIWFQNSNSLKEIFKYCSLKFSETNNIIIKGITIPCNGKNNWNYSSVDSYLLMDYSKNYTRRIGIDVSLYNKFILILPFDKQYNWNGMSSINCGSMCYTWINMNNLNVYKIAYYIMSL